MFANGTPHVIQRLRRMSPWGPGRAPGPQAGYGARAQDGEPRQVSLGGPAGGREVTPGGSWPLTK
jgi:hypothetical protein